MITEYLPKIWQFLNSTIGTLVVMLIGFGLIALQLRRQHNQMHLIGESVKEIDGKEDSVPKLLQPENNKIKLLEATKFIEQNKKINERLQKAISTWEVRHSAREGERDALKTELDEVKIQYKWLHEMADEQASNISNYVVVERAFYCYDTSELDLHRVIFGLDIDNRSVFDISFKETMEGCIELAGQPLLGSKRLIYKPDIAALQKESLTIEQRITPDEMGLVARCKNGEFGAFFYFDNLRIVISHIEQFSQDKPVFLKLPQTVSCNKSKDST